MEVIKIKKRSHKLKVTPIDGDEINAFDRLA